MKNKFWTLAILATLFLNQSSILSAQSNSNAIPIRKNLEIWYGSAPGAPDFVDMLSEYDDPRFSWTQVRQYIHGISFYPGSLTIPPLPLTEGNTYSNLLEKNAFWIVDKRFQKKMSIEIGVVKHHTCMITQAELERTVNNAVDVAIKLYEAGGIPYNFQIDTSLGACTYYKPREAASIVAYWSMLVEERLYKRLAQLKETKPDLIITPIKFRDIEAYPYKRPGDHLAYINEINADRAKYGYPPFDAYTIDIDNRLVSDEDLIVDVGFLIDQLHARGMKVGIILNGEDPTSLSENTDLHYLISANKRMARLKRLGLLDKVDIILVTSWAARFRANKNEPDKRDIPVNVPEDAISHTNFLLHVLRCLGNVTDCNIYPEPR